MGQFDLGEFLGLKKRADESATAPREFPVVIEEVEFAGHVQTLRLQPQLFDGGQVFIAFRPPEREAEFDLIVGREDSRNNGFAPLEVQTERAFEPKNWREDARRGLSSAQFARLRIENQSYAVMFKFFASSGRILSLEYSMICDGSYGRMSTFLSADYDPRPKAEAWATPDEAPALLLNPTEGAFFAWLETEKASTSSIYGISSNWDDLSFEQKHALLPALEREIEPQILTLMRAIIWSDPAFSQDAALQSPRELSRPFWRRPRFWLDQSEDVGEVLHLEPRSVERAKALWPFVAREFAPQFQDEREPVHPMVGDWMRYRGAYIVEFSSPNAHEHLEARLLLRDWLRPRGVELDVWDKNR